MSSFVEGTMLQWRALRFLAFASFVAFGVIAIGGIGSVVAGVLADRLGRTIITSGAMIVSGSSALKAAVLFDTPQEQRRPFCYMIAAWLSWSCTRRILAHNPSSTLA